MQHAHLQSRTFQSVLYLPKWKASLMEHVIQMGRPSVHFYKWQMLICTNRITVRSASNRPTHTTHTMFHLGKHVLLFGRQFTAVCSNQNRFVAWRSPISRGKHKGSFLDLQDTSYWSFSWWSKHFYWRLEWNMGYVNAVGWSQGTTSNSLAAPVEATRCWVLDRKLDPPHLTADKDHGHREPSWEAFTRPSASRLTATRKEAHWNARGKTTRHSHRQHTRKTEHIYLSLYLLCGRATWTGEVQLCTQQTVSVLWRGFISCQTSGV